MGKTFPHRRMGQKLLEDDERPGRPVGVITEDKVSLLEELVLSDRRLKVKEIAEMTKLSDTTVCGILHDHLGMQKIRTEKIADYQSKINNSNNKCKTVWNIVKATTQHRKDRLISEIQYENKTYTNPIDISNVFGDYLATIVHKKMQENFRTLSSSCTVSNINFQQSMFFTPVASDDIIRVISDLPNKKSTGPDEIPISVIKENCCTIAPVLAEIINRSVTNGIFPTSLKLARVCNYDIQKR
nr:unnamed protein product [Callosobruchus analis]